MRNMGRLFQYNRFSENTDEQCKRNKDNFIRNSFKPKMHLQQSATKCPAYAELYTEYSCAATKPTTIPPATAFTTPKSIELAVRKYQEWSSKLLPTATTSATAVTAIPTKSVTHLSSTATAKATSSSQKSSCSCSCTTTSSGFHSHLALLTADVVEGMGDGFNADVDVSANERALLVGAVKRCKVYDCMKDFLRRKLFQQNSGSVAHKQLSSDTEEDVTSDYDEVDILNSSYNADEEDFSDCSSNYSYPAAGEERQSRTPAPKSNSPQKSLLSLNCWHNSASSTDATTDEEHDDQQESCVEHGLQPITSNYCTHIADDSDAGISDCCQLIDETSNNAHHKRSHRRSIKSKRRTRFTLDSEAELLASTWYQPHITTKGVLEQLWDATPGSFLVRRKSRTYELSLRDETKVKHFVVISTADNYKLKGAKKQFTSLKALITHHSVMAEQLPVTLALPREQTQRQRSRLRYADDFDTYESLQYLGILEALQTPDDDQQRS